MTPTDILMKLHISAGASALATFLIPMLAKKGGRLHRRAGWVFVCAMAIICMTAIPVSIVRLNAATSPGAALFSKGALFVTLLSGSAVWKGMRVLRFKGQGRHSHPLDIGVSLLMVTAGARALVEGISSRNGILLFFGPFAALGALADLRYWLNPNKPRMHWFFEHMGGMVGASTAAITAFLFFGARSLGAGTPRLVEFLTPTLILVPASLLLRRHYRRKFALGIGGAPRPSDVSAGLTAPASVPLRSFEPQ